MGDVLNRGTKHRPLWYCRYIDENGVRRQRATRQPTKALAVKVLEQLESDVAAKKLGLPPLIPQPAPVPEPPKGCTVRELAVRFLAEYASPDIKDLERYRNEARSIFKVRILPAFGDRMADDLTTEDAEAQRDRELADGYAEGSVALTLAALSKLYNWARKKRLVACPNPVEGCKRTRSAQSLDYLSHEETARLLEHAEAAAPNVFPMIAVAVYAGLRKGELFGLRWNDLALDAPRIDVNRSYRGLPKSGKVRYLPLHPELARILRFWRDCCPPTDEGLVLPVSDRRGNWRMGIKEDMLGIAALLETAGCHVPAKPWHALRHTFASHFMMSGGSILTLQKLLGHSDLKMTMVYAHLSPDYLGGEVARMSFTRPEASLISLNRRSA